MKKLKWLLIIFTVFILLLLLIIFSKLKVILHYYHDRDNDHLKIEFRAWFGLIRYKMDIPLIKVDDNSPTVVVKEKTAAGPQENSQKKDTKQISAEDMLDSMHDATELLKHVLSMYRIIRHFLSRITVRKLDWHTVVGIGDAAYTGMLTGAFWAAKGSIIGLLSHYMKLKAAPDITITPHFQFAVSQSAITCIFQFRIGHAMFAGIKLIKYWKGGRPEFRTKPLSVLSNDKSKSI